MSVAHPEDFARKMSTALSLQGMRFLLLHSPCPTGWKSEPQDSVELVRLAVASGLFPVYEVYDGATYRINIEPDGTDPAEYFHRQRRFKDEEIDLDVTRRDCTDRMQRLRALAELYPCTT
jgi:pyruvate/2-oxoacid:ferredoxin oxidoreductase beta subunit